MAPPGNGIFVVRGEMATLMTAMKRGARWNSASYQPEEEQDGLTKQFVELKATLAHIEDLRLIEPNVFLGPFLDVIRSEETTGPITSLALSTINKFLSYGLIDPTHSALAATVENIADAVTHARFVGTDQASDGVVLMKIVQVLRTLMLNPEGSALTNESVCEVMLSCFRLCFEPRLNELLRRTAEHALKDIVLLLFMRLPQFAEERNAAGLIKRLKMMAGSVDATGKKSRKTKPKVMVARSAPSIRKNSLHIDEPIKDGDAASPVAAISSALLVPKAPVLATTPATPLGNIVDMQGKMMQTPTSSTASEMNVVSLETIAAGNGNVLVDESGDLGMAVKESQQEQSVDESQQLLRSQSVDNDADVEDADTPSVESDTNKEDFVNSMGVRFTPVVENETSNTTLTPYGLPCIRELLRFLISLCNPLDKQNTDTMMHMGLSLLTVALEVGADSIGKYDTLMALVKDDMCKNLFALLSSERLTIFAADLQVCFLLFESLRSNLKFHLEFYLAKLSEIIGSENQRTPYEMRELALDNVLQFCRIPGFAAELYINYDCNLYCTNLLEDLVKLLSKNTLSATMQLHIYSVHQMSLDGLLIIVENIEKNCAVAKMSGNTAATAVAGATSSVATGRHSKHAAATTGGGTFSGGESSGVESIGNFMQKAEPSEIAAVTPQQLLEIKNKKRILTQGTELFNQRPDKGIQFLQDNGILNVKLDPMEVALFLRENSGLDKAMIGEYISKKKNVESKILENFVGSFDFTNTRIDMALRQYLETFRLPGEAPLIFLVMEHFAEHWHVCNKEPFAHTDSAFRLAYAIIMLNMDQHNYNAKRLNIPMTVEDFVKNLRGLNGNADFDPEMLHGIFNGIKNEEIIMPAEQTGLIRENYLWKVLLRRGSTKDGFFNYVDSPAYDRLLFQLVWGPSLSAISFMFDKATDALYQKPLIGLQRGAVIAAHYNLHEDFDALVLTLCKFTTLLSVAPEANDIATSVAFGMNGKAQLAMKTVFGMVHQHGDCIRESWKCVLDVVVQLFRLKLLSKSMMEVEDFCEVSGRVALLLEKPLQKTDVGIFSSLYSYLSSEGQRQPTYEEQEIIKVSRRCVKECQVDQIIAETKFLQFESLQELLSCFCAMLKAPASNKSLGLPYAEEIVVFLMELMVRTLIQNRDRMLQLWPNCRDQIYLLLIGSAGCGYQYLLVRTTVALLKLAIYLMRSEELCSVVLQSLKMLLMLKPNVIFGVSRQISTGIYELLKTSAQNIHSETDWDIVFTLLECVGAGAIPPDLDLPAPVGTTSDGAVSSEEEAPSTDRGYTSDSELTPRTSEATATMKPGGSTPYLSPSGENWILVNKETDITVSCPTTPTNSLTYPCRLLNHSSFALVKCWDSLAFIVRNVAHITPYNFESCVKCIRTFVEASLNGGKHALAGGAANVLAKQRGHRKAKRDAVANRNVESSDSEDDEDLQQRYEFIAIQLLDLMHTLHTRTAQIFRWWAEEGGALPQHSALWAHGWCPLLQGIARLANDRRRQVRMNAITCLQRALLVHDLQALTGPEWSSCFKQVIFPLLFDLLAETPSNIEPALLDESRIRTATIMSKVFLHHLTPLITLATFSELWLEILDYLEKFIKVGSDMLYEAMLEGLKNMLLVMNSVRVFHTSDGVTHTALWDTTWNRIGEFLPQLKDELFRNEVHQSHNISAVQPTQAGPVTILYPPAFVMPTQVDQHYQSTPAAPVPYALPSSVPMAVQHQQPTTGLLHQSQMETGQELPPIHFVSSPVHVPADSVREYRATEAISPLSENELLYSTTNGNAEQFVAAPSNAYVLDFDDDAYTTDLLANGVVADLTLSPPHHDGVAPQSSSDSDAPRIPISHLIATNQYPSLTTVPQNIAKSFAPIYVQPQMPQPTSDIYNDYVNNPYNLVLQVDNGAGAASAVQAPENRSAAIPITSQFASIGGGGGGSGVGGNAGATVSNVFHASNYFADKSATIPPGSEILFNGP